MPPLTIDDCIAGLDGLINRRTVKFDQSMFFTPEQQHLMGGGVCKAICLLWVKRKLFTGKASFAVSKKGAQAAPLADRLARKGPQLAVAQPLVNAVDSSARGVLDALAPLGNKWAALTQVSVAELGDGPRKGYIPSELVTEADQAKGRALFSEALERCVSPPTNRRDAAPILTPEVRTLLAQGRESEVERTVRYLAPNYDSACFILDLEGKRMRKAMRARSVEDRAVMVTERYSEYRGGFKSSGHSVALYIDKRNGSVDYIDPNLGEYHFAMAEREQLLELFHFVWNYYALAAHTVYDRYTISYFGR